ncbi:hypothetical protein IX51_05670 [uncultured archaeon]|nr:hypothetical protein IX51_05670 [uncultured archaeon]
MVYFRAKKALTSHGQSCLSESLLSYLVLPDGVRFISSDDMGKEFKTGEDLMDRYDLSYYYRRSLEPGTIVMVLEHNQEVAGLSLLVVDDNTLTIEMLAKNMNVKRSGVGAEILGCIEETIADQLMVNEIRLESLNRKKLLNFYNRMGFISYGPPSLDREWGIIFPMRKRIVSLEN